MKTFKKIAIAAALVAAMSTTAQATPIVGHTNLTLGLVQVSLGEIDWNPPINIGVDLAPTYGAFLTHPFAIASSGSFSAITGTAGLVQDMSNNPADANFIPLGANNTPSFLQFAARPNWQFTALYLAPGTTFGMYTSPYTLTEVAGNTSATITLTGTACDTGANLICDAGEDITNWMGIFSSQYNMTIAAMIAQLTSAPGAALPDNTWSATISVPEPGSLALLGLGLLGLGALRLRREV